MENYVQVQSDERQAFAQVTNRLQTALARDRKIRLLKALLTGVATGGLAAAVAGLGAPAQVMHWAAGGLVVGTLGGAVRLWQNAPQLLDLARKADHSLATDLAVETAIEGWVKDAPVNDVTRLLRDRVDNRTQDLPPAALVPLDATRHAVAAGLAVALALVVPFLPFAPSIQSATERSAVEEGLAAIAALRDNPDDALNALAAQADALLAAIAAGTEADALAEAMAALQDDTAIILTEASADKADLETLEDALSRLSIRAEGNDALPPSQTADSGPGSVWDDKGDPQISNAEIPMNDLVSVPPSTDQGSLEDENLSCEFGDEPSCNVRPDGERPAVQNSYDEDIPENGSVDQLTRGGAPTASIASAGDTGTTGIAEAALYGEAAPVSALDAAFSADTITLSADNPLGAGRRGRSDMTSAFNDGAITRFPDAPVVGQPGWQRATEQPVSRMPIDPALAEALRNYYPAPEIWR